jgi:hypothetical protein
MRWLAVNTPAMHLDHEPKDAFERKAVEVLASGKGVFEATENGIYGFAGSITLSSECLSCHLSKRTSNDEKVGGLLIRMRSQQP